VLESDELQWFEGCTLHLGRSDASLTDQGDYRLTNPGKIRVAVIGVGAFGRNHARVYHDLAKEGVVEFVGVVDSNATRAAQVASEFGIQAFASLAELVERGKPEAASVAVPTQVHLPVVRDLVQKGVDVMVEKPVAPTLADADEMMRLAKQHGRIAQAGQLERFNPAVRATLPLLTKPMFFEVHRLSVFTPRSLDVDVVLDLMIHDIDIVLSFVQSPVKEIRAVGLPILTPKVDIANVRMEFESGCVANFTASRVSTERIRKLRFFQPQQYLSLDYTRQDVVAFTVSTDGAQANGIATLLAGMDEEQEHPSSPQIKISKPEVVREEPLRAELCAFLQSVRDRSIPGVPLEDGRRALAVALEILEVIRQHSHNVNLDKLR
jgi:predicted dehydrogenase